MSPSDADSTAAPPTVAVIGAETPVGRRMPESFPEASEIRGIIPNRAGDAPETYDSVRRHDPFSIRQTASALEGSTWVVYAGHGTAPEARLAQGERHLFDRLAAERAAAAAAIAEIERGIQIIELFDVASSPKPSSQLQCLQQTFDDAEIPTTTLYSDFFLDDETPLGRIMKAVARRGRPAPCPGWSTTTVQVHSTSSVASSAAKLLRSEASPRRVTRLRHSRETSLCELARRVLKRTDASPETHRTRLDWPRAFAAWVRWRAGLPYHLMRDVIDVLRSTELPGSTVTSRHEASPRIDAVLDELAETPRALSQPKPTLPTTPPEGLTVFSLQKHPLPDEFDAEWAAREYVHWLPAFLSPFLRRDEDEATGEHRLCLRGTSLSLLELTEDRASSSTDRTVFRITGGWLVSTSEEGRLEFSSSKSGETLYTSVENFHPALPWFLYRWTQALVHRWIMYRFGLHLARIGSERDASHT